MKKVKGSDFDYETFKKVALNSELVQKRYNLSAIDVDEQGRLIVNGQTVLSNDGVVSKQLLKAVLDLNPRLVSKFQQLLGKENTKEFITLLKNAVVAQKDASIVLVANPETKLVTNILPGSHDLITNRMALDMFEATMNTESDLKLINGAVRSDGGMELSVLKDTVINPGDFASIRQLANAGKLLKGEEFNPGYTFANNPLKGMQVSHFTNRLVCENGMSMRVDKGDFSVNVLADDAMRKFFEGFQMLAKDKFVASFYPEQIAKAASQSASLFELRAARNLMMQKSDLKEKDVNVYLPEFSATTAALARKGVDYAKCSDQQLHNFATSYKMWDVVNRLTDFGSHDYGFNADFPAIQKQAGELFLKPVYDTENLILL